jgi:hypothetical protein
MTSLALRHIVAQGVLMSLPRLVLPELLDQLPANDPGAIRIRRDLNFINAFLPNARFMARSLANHFANKLPSVLLDIGGGDGTFMLRVAQRLAPRWQNVTVTLLDQQNLVDSNTRESFAALNWKIEAVTADVFDFLEQTKASSVSGITTNLFLHHFQQEQLARLLGHVARSTSLFVACEPRRAKLSLRLSQLAWVIGCDDLSCYDAAVSALAGFRGGEISALWPSQDEWQLHEYTRRPFSQFFVARREN